MNTVYKVLKKYIDSSDFKNNTDLLNYWASCVIESKNYGFETGLLGLGWLINFLIHENIVDGNADEILEDIDDVLYKLTIKEVLEKEIDVNKILDFITFYQQRLIYNSSAHFYRRFTHFECMKLLVEKTNTFILHTDLSIQNLDLVTNTVLKYSFLTKTCINEELIEDAFYQCFEKVIEFTERQINSLIDLNILYKLGLAAMQYENPIWKKKVDYIISKSKNDSNSYLRSIFEQSTSGEIIISNQDNALFLMLEGHEIFFLKTNLKYN